MTEQNATSGINAAIFGALAGVVASVCTVAVAALTGWFAYASKDEELRVHLVEVALSILRAKPDEGVANARGWAIAVIEKNSGVDFNPEDRKQLLLKPIKVKDYSSDYNSDFSSGRGAVTGMDLQNLSNAVTDLQKKVDKLSR